MRQEDVKKIKELEDYYLGFMYPGCKMPIILAIKDNEAIYNAEEMAVAKAINRIAKYVGNELSSSSVCYSESGFLYDRRYNENYDDVLGMTFENYMDNYVGILNCLTLAKIFATESSKEENKDKIYFISYDGEEHSSFYEIYETLDGISVPKE